jgi:hypothetical protein
MFIITIQPSTASATAASIAASNLHNLIEF